MNRALERTKERTMIDRERIRRGASALRAVLASVLLALPLLATGGCRASDWESELRRELPRVGHRNVIAIVDSAYPAQIAPGVKLRVIGGDQVEAVAALLAALAEQPHVRAKVLLDAELLQVSETAAPGITAYRERLAAALGAAPVEHFPHEQLIARIDARAQQFEVLVLKTNLALPYTSVFIELDCGYWDAAREADLRARMAAGPGK